MSIISIVLIAIGLAMDAFAVSLTIGFKVPHEKKLFMALKTALFFGIAQGIMPVIGWFLGSNFQRYIERVDHWIAFVLLVYIGAKMAYEGIKGDEGDENNSYEEYSNKRLFILSIATSIDALAVGITFGALSVSILTAAIIIAVITFVICFMGVYLGKIASKILQGKAEIVGGIILIAIGIKILLEHTGFL